MVGHLLGFSVFLGLVLMVIAIVVGVRLGQAIGGDKTTQQRRMKLAQKAAPFLQPSEQIKSVFRAQVQDRTSLQQPYIFVVTDRAIVLLDCSFAGKPWQVHQRYSPNLRFGPLHKSPWGLFGGFFTFDDTTYQTAWMYFADVEAADAALSEMAQHQSADWAGHEIPPTSSADAQPDASAAAPADIAVSSADRPPDPSASPTPRKPPISTRVVHLMWNLVGFLTLIRVSVEYPVSRWIALPLLLFFAWRILLHVGRYMHRAWVGHKGIHAPIWLLGGFIVGIIAAMVIPGNTGADAGALVWAGSLVVALFLFIAWARDAIHRRRATT